MLPGVVAGWTFSLHLCELVWCAAAAEVSAHVGRVAGKGL